MTRAEIAARIQHTNVKPDATISDVERLLAECLQHRFDGAMVNPIWIPLARERLAGSGVKVCTALDFPIGGGTTQVVAAATAAAVEAGADQIDVMTKVGWLKSGMDVAYRDHLKAVVEAARGAPVKAMLEASLLNASELARAVDLCVEAGIFFVKNSSGYGGGDASVGIITRLVELAGGRVGVKASGGIRSYTAAVALADAGAALLGASASVAIVANGDAIGEY